MKSLQPYTLTLFPSFHLPLSHPFYFVSYHHQCQHQNSSFVYNHGNLWKDVFMHWQHPVFVFSYSDLLTCSLVRWSVCTLIQPCLVCGGLLHCELFELSHYKGYEQPGAVAHVWILATLEAEIGRITVVGQSRQIVWETPNSKITRAKYAVIVTQAVEHMFYTHKSLSSKPSFNK
jgi:hypothetical protein